MASDVRAPSSRAKFFRHEHAIRILTVLREWSADLETERAVEGPRRIEVGHRSRLQAETAVAARARFVQKMAKHSRPHALPRITGRRSHRLDLSMLGAEFL